MTMVCVIRYRPDPFERDAFKTYAENWGRIIHRYGGHLVGYFLPDAGTNDLGWGLLAFDSLASCKRYRAGAKCDKEARESFATAEAKRSSLREVRNFAQVVDGTLGILPALAGAE